MGDRFHQPKTKENDMAKIKAVRHGRTKNLGNYESARSDIEIDLEPGDTVAGALSAARALVALDLGEMDGPTCAAEIRRLVKAGELSDRGLKGTGLL